MAHVCLLAKTNNILSILILLSMIQFTLVVLEQGCLYFSVNSATHEYVDLAELPKLHRKC